MTFNRNQGFSLLELVMVVAVIGILSTFAVGFYRDNIISANRTEARSTLAEVAASLEKCRALYGVYDHANCSVALPVTSDSNLYSIDDGGTLAASTFTLTATPVAGESQASDTECATFTLTNTGIKGSTGGGECW